MMAPTYNGATIGLVIEGNAYFCDLARYRAMSSGELLAERADLAAGRKASARAFFRHRTVLWFLGASMLFLTLLLVTWHAPVHPGFVVLVSAGVAATAYWMSRARESVFNGMKLIEAQLKIVDACLANQAAWAVYGERQVSGPGRTECA